MHAASTTSSVHPRRRGEQFFLAWAKLRVSGSSPQARGTAALSSGRGLRHRFIPAGAGNSLRNWSFPGKTAVHPRRRGEQPCSHPCRCTQRGSSPQARGTGRRHERPGRYRRFIPAGAGNRTARTASGYGIPCRTAAGFSASPVVSRHHPPKQYRIRCA